MTPFRFYKGFSKNIPFRNLKNVHKLRASSPNIFSSHRCGVFSNFFLKFLKMNESTFAENQRSKKFFFLVANQALSFLLTHFFFPYIPPHSTPFPFSPSFVPSPSIPFQGRGGTLSSISLPIERAPPLSNFLHTIYLGLLVFVYCIDFLYHCINFCDIIFLIFVV